MLETLQLRCTACGGELDANGVALRCVQCGATYPTVDGAPQFIDAAVDPERGSPAARVLQRAAANPLVYNAITLVFGEPIIGRVLQRQLADAGGKTILDVGAGTGNLADRIPRTARYVWLDPDPRKLEGLRRKRPDVPALLADAARIPLADASVDWAASVAVSHHLPDDALAASLHETARVTRERFLFLDAVASRRITGRLLWRYDRGAFVRSRDTLLDALAVDFDLEIVRDVRLWHDYVLCVGTPRGRASSS